jgi:hypothetical protein
MEGKDVSIHDKVRADVFDELSYSQRLGSNLSIAHRVLEKGETVGPAHQKIKADKASILVFADDDPHANFSHACRYLFYDAETGDFHREVAAQFPPVVSAEKPLELIPFHQGKPFIDNPIVFRPWPILRCPILWQRQRYAILWSGMSNKRHLNDMEFLYRTLIDRYGFRADHIYAMSYDGTLNTQDGVQTHWPGDGTPYRINITGQGTRADFEAAVDDLKGKIDSDDLLLVHVNNHGNWAGTAGSATFCTYPSWADYSATDFAAKLGELPKFDKLIAMLEPCHAGGFNAPIIAQSAANATSVASAALEPYNSYVSADGNWDPFARDWVAAQAGHDAFGAALAFDPDTDHDGKIEAEEAFWYADVVKLAADTPNFSESSEVGGDIVLGRTYVVWWWWCFILKELLEEHYYHLPIPEYYERLHKIQPELEKLAKVADRHSEELRKEMTPELKKLVEQAFR